MNLMIINPLIFVPVSGLFAASTQLMLGLSFWPICITWAFMCLIYRNIWLDRKE